MKGKEMKQTPKIADSFFFPLHSGVVAPSPSNTREHEANKRSGGDVGIHVEKKGDRINCILHFLFSRIITRCISIG